MDEKEEENDETSSIINHASKPPISNNPSNQTDPQSFTITPKDLSNLMNLYKDRQGNYQILQRKRWNTTFTSFFKNRC